MINKEDIYIPYEDEGKIKFLSTLQQYEIKNMNHNKNQLHKYYLLVSENSNQLYQQHHIRVFKKEWIQQLLSESISKRISILSSIFSHENDYIQNTYKLDESNAFVQYFIKQCEKNVSSCKTKFITFAQIQKIIQMN